MVCVSHKFVSLCVILQYNPKPSRVLGVFGLSLYTGEKDLKELFTKYGPLDRIQVVYDHQVSYVCS